MASTRRACLFVMLLATVSGATLVSSTQDDFLHCESAVSSWASSSFENAVEEGKLTLKDLLFFLHVPRTGGRTYFHCFLRKLYTSNQECPRSYDKLRFDPSKSNCRLMVTHDDYSMMSKLPKERTSVVTILRNPIDRVFSTYEFSVEVAARFLVHPNLTSATQMSARIRPKSRGVSTLDIWPWKYLVPWMREDLFARRDVRRRTGLVEAKEISDPYNMEEIVMPLHIFINDPIAHDIIHNGATFQVAGLTNNSHLAESHEVRHCVRKHPLLGRYVLEVAKKRLNSMLYVGLMEEHRKSATMFADMVGVQVLSQSESLGSHTAQVATNSSEVSSSPDFPPDGLKPLQDSIDDHDHHVGEVPSMNDVEAINGNMTVRKLMEAYEVCISSLRKSQASRRAMSLKKIAPANFSKEARLLVSERVLQQILSLNSLDVELYRHAEGIFVQQQKHLSQSMGDITERSQQHHVQTMVRKTSMCSDTYGCFPWKPFLLATPVIFLTVIIYLVVTARKRTYKLKV